MRLPRFLRGSKTVVRKDPTQEYIRALIRIWETKVKPDLQVEISVFTDEELRTKTLPGFLDRVESRIMAQIVLDTIPPPPTVDKKGGVVHVVELKEPS